VLPQRVQESQLCALELAYAEAADYGTAVRTRRRGVAGLKKALDGLAVRPVDGLYIIEWHYLRGAAVIAAPFSARLLAMRPADWLRQGSGSFRVGAQLAPKMAACVVITKLHCARAWHRRCVSAPAWPGDRVLLDLGVSMLPQLMMPTGYSSFKWQAPPRWICA